MTTSPFLPLPSHLRITQTMVDALGVHVSLLSPCDTASCPLCSRVSTRVRSSYVRTVTDVLAGGQRVTLYLRVRRYMYGNPACPQQVFAEQVPTWVRPHAQQTERHQEAIVQMGFATSGNQGARLAQRLGMPTSRSTINRAIMHLPVPPVEALTNVGFDDFGVVCGHRYGTIVLDLASYQVVDLLPDRTVSTTATWLRAHPAVTVVSRDRGGAYAEGVRHSGASSCKLLTAGIY